MKKAILIFIVSLITVLSFSVISFAETMSMPELPEYVYDYYIIYKHIGGNTFLASCTQEFVFDSGVINESSVTNPKSYSQYQLVNNEWSLINNVTDYYGTNRWSSDEIYYSNSDIYYKGTNNVFFSKTITPLYILDNKTLLRPLSLSVTQNTQILLLCGVGILSLILLVGLFRKLYLFL